MKNPFKKQKVIFDLKFIRYQPGLESLDINKDGMRHLEVEAANRDEALLMRRYIIDEGLES